MLWSLYKEVNNRVLFGNYESDWFSQDYGVKQGCVLPPTLFSILMNDFVSMLEKAGVGVNVSNQLINSLLFADDITLIANSEQELTLLDITSKFADKWKLKFNATKSKVMVVGRRIDREKVWKLGDNCIHETNEYKYLGVYVTRTLKSNYHVQTYIKDNMDNKINFILRIPAEHGNFNRVEFGDALWNSVLRPSISHCG